MKFAKSFLILLITAAVFMGATNANKEEVSTRPSAEVKWMTIEEAFAANQKKPKKIFVDVYTDWCGWCKKMDVNTFQKEEVASYLNENYYAVKFNAEQRETVKLGSQEFKFIAEGNRGYHQLAAALMQGRMSYPTVVVMNEKFQILSPIPGYREPAEMKQILEFYATDQHLKPQPKKQGK